MRRIFIHRVLNIYYRSIQSSITLIYNYRILIIISLYYYRVLTRLETRDSVDVGMKKIIEKLFGRKKRTLPRDFEWERFQESAKKQFKILKDKGINIPVITI